MKLSIIVPIYKVEPYLRRCVDSILAQTFQDFELILVDDGSPDGCPAICDEYARKDSRIKVIHKENGGLSDARNAGLEIAQGEYIGFVDSDDYILPDMYRQLMALQERTNADITACGIFHVDHEGSIFDQWPHLTEDQVYRRNDFIDNFFPDVRRNIMPASWNKLYKKDVFKDIRFPKGKIYEDAQIQLQLFDKCQVIAVCHEHLYCYYCIRSGSIINSSYSEKKFDSIDFSIRNYQFFGKLGNQTQMEYTLDGYANNYMKNFFQVMLFHRELIPRFKPYRDEFRKYLPDVLKNSRICKMKKIAILLMFVHKKMSYKLCLRLFPECVLGNDG